MSLSLPAQALKVSSWLLAMPSVTVSALAFNGGLLGLGHVGIEVVEVAQLLRPEAGICVCRVVPLVMLDINEDIVLLCGCKQLLVVFKQLDRWLRDEDVDSTFDGIQGDGVVGGIRRKDCDYRKSVSQRKHIRSRNSLALPFGSASIAVLNASGSVLPSLGNSSKDTSNPLYASEMFFCRCSPAQDQHYAAVKKQLRDPRIAGNLPPETPTMDSLPTLPRLRRSNSVRPTTPTFLSEVDAPPPTKPVVYSPVPTYTWR